MRSGAHSKQGCPSDSDVLDHACRARLARRCSSRAPMWRPGLLMAASLKPKCEPAETRLAHGALVDA